MNDTELIRQLKEQNKLLRAECKAAEEMEKAMQVWFANHTEQSYNKFIRKQENWQAAAKARKATEPPF